VLEPPSVPRIGAATKNADMRRHSRQRYSPNVTVDADLSRISSRHKCWWRMVREKSDRVPFAHHRGEGREV
jgi:hypothetical protein